MEIISFGADNVENVIAGMNQKQLDEVAFGVIQVNAKGEILLYNSTEGEIAGYDHEAAVGKNFFTDVAPCTNLPGFRDKFDAGVKAKKLNVVFEWQFTGRISTRVQVHMKAAPGGDRYWIFVKRL